MPISQMRNGLTAEKSLFSQRPNIKVSRSKFDLSRLNDFTCDIGMIVPVDLIPTVPGDSYNLDCQYKIDFRPLIVPTLTAYKVKVHYYYCPNQYLWSGWESFISKGRSGRLSLTVPTIKTSNMLSTTIPKMRGLTDSSFGANSTGEYYPYTSGSLLDYLIGNVPYDVAVGDSDTNTHYLPYGFGNATLTRTGNTPIDVNALPFLMYQKIYRSNYIDPNLYSNGTVESQVWFPDDIDSTDWRFDYTSSNLGGDFNAFFVPQRQTLPTVPVANFVPVAHTIGDNSQQYDNVVNLTQLRYSMYTDDMFTTALPFLQRGPQTMLDLDPVLDATFTGTGVSGLVDLPPYMYLRAENNALSTYLLGINASSTPVQLMTNPGGSSLAFASKFGFVNSDVAGNAATSLLSRDGTVIPSGDISIVSQGIAFSAQQLRSLLALSVWQERNALTNGSYGQFIKVHFDDYPSNQYCEPIYIGGTTSVFNVSSVVQTSESSSTPQGTQTGIGGSSNSSSVGRFNAQDYGFIMALMTIIPDTVYTQTHEHWEFDTSPDDYFMPEYEQLSYQPILNKQLFSNGTASDDDLFGYSNRYVYMKQRDSIARGRFALPANIDSYYHSYVQSRHFTSVPKLSQQFVTVYPPNIDRSFLAYPGEPAFLVQFFSGVHAVRPMSYVSQPNTFGF